MSIEPEVGFRITQAEPKRTIWPFNRKSLIVVVEAIGAPSIVVTVVRPSGSRFKVLSVQRYRIDFAAGERIAGAARKRDLPEPGRFLTPDQLRDLGWCRNELNRRMRAVVPISTR